MTFRRLHTILRQDPLEGYLFHMAVRVESQDGWGRSIGRFFRKRAVPPPQGPVEETAVPESMVMVDLPAAVEPIVTPLTVRPNPQGEGSSLRRKDLIALGGTIREADTNDQDELRAVLGLYLQPSAIPHFAYVEPTDTIEQLQQYYTTHPEAKLFVAVLPGEEIVGAVTKAPEEGVRSAKLNRLVVREDMQGRGVGSRLVREVLAHTFHEVDDEGRPKYVRIIAGVINFEPRREKDEFLGSQIAMRLFENFGFIKWHKPTPDICKSWSLRQGKSVDRPATMMMLLRGDYTRRTDVSRGTSLPPLASGK